MNWMNRTEVRLALMEALKRNSYQKLAKLTTVDATTLWRFVKGVGTISLENYSRIVSTVKTWAK